METIDLQVEAGAATILLNRPDVLNAWNKQFGDDLHEAIQRCTDDDAVRAVVIRGAGMRSPSIAISVARAMPTRVGTNSDEPPSGTRPMFTKASRK